MKKSAFIVIFLLFLSGIVHSQGVPANIKVQFILKILTMDKKMNRFGDKIKIGVTSDEILGAFKGVSGITINGKPFIVTKLSSPGEVSNYNVVFIDTNWKGSYDAAGQKAAAGKALMFCSEEEGVKNNRGGIGFKVIDGKPKILSNINNIKKQGSEFPVNFYKMSVLIK